MSTKESSKGVTKKTKGKGVTKKTKGKGTQKGNNTDRSYYLIHDNGGKSMLVLIENKTLTVHKVVNEKEGTKKTTEKTLEFKDYTESNNQKIKVLPEVLFKINNFKKLFIGYDVDPENTWIKNKKFGVGNSMLVYDGKDYYSICYYSITKLNTSKIKGKVIGYISPIGNNDVAYPMMFTDTHIYNWCDDIYQYKIPDDTKTRNIIKLLSKLKNPFEIPKNKISDINKFYEMYKCNDSTTQLEQKVILKVSYWD